MYKRQTKGESHASAVSLLESGEQRYIKAINNNNNKMRFEQDDPQRYGRNGLCHNAITTVAHLVLSPTT